jgi:hypothetical protein
MRPSAYVCSAAAAGLILAFIQASHGSGGGILPASVASVPGIASGGGSTSETAWARDFLSAIHEPVTRCNVRAIVAWEVQEGGGITNDASYNPLNTARHEPGSWPIPGNPDDVQAYPSYSEGLEANAAAIENGLYGNILNALAAGDSAEAVARAVDDNPHWGTHGLSASC